ncbi:MAG: PhzF family phenazine biosynthesis protein [Candidatus Tectomicrobia bacterium]|nr:PhzF family phenazine biosynthesis protein [Candidatus Tectomicrobia bacterium]
MTAYRFVQVDVFTSVPFGGNQLAVFTDARELDDRRMLAIAREMNYSESTFIFPTSTPGADWRVRIFTPGGEVPFAGHPTLGTAFVLADAGMLKPAAETTTMVLELGVGLIPVELRRGAQGIDLVTMEQKLPRYGPVFQDAGLVAEALSIPAAEITGAGLPMEVVWTGLHFLMVPVCSLKAMQRMRVNLDAFERIFADLPTNLLYAFCRETVAAAAQVHARMFAPGINVPEDPATGSASGCLGAYLARHGLLPEGPTARLVAEQGLEMQRPSRILIEVRRRGEEITAIRVGGQVVKVAEGWLFA